MDWYAIQLRVSALVIHVMAIQTVNSITHIMSIDYFSTKCDICLMLFGALLMPCTTVNCAITHTNLHVFYNLLVDTVGSVLFACGTG